jgi:nucleotide-binding universal stress UspA family protein
MSSVTVEHKTKERIIPHLETAPLHIKRMLVATDLSQPATRALKFAARLAKQLHSELHVLYTVMPQLYLSEPAPISVELQKVEIDQARHELHRYAFRIPEVRTLKHEEIALAGPPADAILEIVELKGIDLVVMGSHGRSGLKKVAMGSVAEATIRRAHCPVLVVGPHCVRRYGPLSSILLAADLPAVSLRAAQYATSLAKESGASLTILHVLPERAKAVSAIAEENAMQELRQLAPNDNALRKQLHFEVATGDPVQEIVSIAKHGKSKLIVMGAREQTAFADHSPWTTLSNVIRKAHCPVLAVPPHFA